MLHPLAFGGVASAAGSRIPPLYRSCKAFNARYPHGVGKTNAHDVTYAAMVTDFAVNTLLYNLAVHYNRALDSDHDGIACETDSTGNGFTLGGHGPAIVGGLVTGFSFVLISAIRRRRHRRL